MLLQLMCNYAPIDVSYSKAAVSNSMSSAPVLHAIFSVTSELVYVSSSCGLHARLMVQDCTCAPGFADGHQLCLRLLASTWKGSLTHIFLLAAVDGCKSTFAVAKLAEGAS